MKLFGPIFWGVFLILAGIVFLLKYLLPYQFSAWSVVVGLFVILIGGSLLWGSLHPDQQSTIVPGTGVFTNAGSKYDMAFSNTTLDLTGKKPEDGVITIDVAFSNVEVKLPEGAVEIEVDTAFSGITLPDGQSMSFGERTFARGEGQALRIKVDAAFCHGVFK